MEELATVLLGCLGLLLQPLLEVIEMLEMLVIHAIGFIFAVVIGHFLINCIMKMMHESVDPFIQTKHLWQYLLLGFTERILYLSSFLYGAPEFIAFWVFAKIAFPWHRWTSGEEIGRTFFMNTVIGNGLSILFAAVGYGIISWYRKETWEHYLWVIVPILLTLACIAAIIYLHKEFKKEHHVTYKKWKETKKNLPKRIS